MKVFFLVAALFMQGCLSITKEDLASKSDYYLARSELKAQHPAKALKVFHTKEPNGFITTVEKGWLGILSGEADLEALQRAATELDKRQILSISKSAESFFYKEYEDGYYPAEHEAIVLHLVTAMAFAEQGRRKEALIETRRAAFYLEAEYAPDRRPFDDPGLRLWLAAMWTYCEQWQHARVDLRVAGKALNHSQLMALAEMPKPPAQLDLVFLGPGPEVVWDDADFTDVVFVPGIGDAKATITRDQGKGESLPILTSTASWYSRHKHRNRVIQDVLETSKYMVTSSSYAAAAGATFTAGTIASGTILTLGIAGGIAVGGAGIYLGILLESAEVAAFGVGAGLGVAGYGVQAAKHTMSESSDTASGIAKEGFDRSNYYRFVRFLPDYIGFAWSKRSSKSSKITLEDHSGTAPFLTLTAPQPRALVNFYFAANEWTQRRALKGIKGNMWTSPDGERVWLMHPHVQTAKEASATCAAYETQERWKFRLPTGSEIAQALRHGIAKPRINEKFGEHLATLSSKLWSTSMQLDGHQCQYVDLLDRSESLSVDCAQKVGVLCVAIP